MPVEKKTGDTVVAGTINTNSAFTFKATKVGSETLLAHIVKMVEEALMGLTKTALADVLGREPTKQEVWRVHAGFKRMAFMLLDHLDHIKKHENENSNETTLPEDMEADDEEAADPEGSLGEKGEPLK